MVDIICAINLIFLVLTLNYIYGRASIAAYNLKVVSLKIGLKDGGFNTLVDLSDI